jgi:mRNA-degrading endonuclease toxin of MazEF toxin-antitoxin module
MSALKRLYRVTAVWPITTTRRDYQTKAAAERHAESLRCFTDKVTITVSDPITWPTP